MDILEQAKKLRFFLALFHIPFVALLIGLGCWSLWANIPLTSLMREPQAAAESPFYWGIGSMLGGFLWSATAGVCFFCWKILQVTADRKFLNFLLFWGLMTTNLLLDDAFQLHEEFYPGWLGIGQKTTYLAYGFLFVLGVGIFRDVFLKTDYLLFLIALAFFGLSVFVDLIQEQLEPIMGQLRILLEDGSKLLGIATWLAYFWRTSAKQISVVRAPRTFPTT